MNKVNKQKAKFKEILLLREKGFTFEQIAEKFGVRMNTAYMWYRRLKEKFKDEIDSNNITNAKAEEIRELNKFKELLDYRKKGMTWKEIAKIKHRKEHSMIRIFGDYKKRHFHKLQPEDYHTKIICKECGKEFEINLFSLNKSFSFCSKKCEKNYFNKKASRENKELREQEEKERQKKFNKIRELRVEKKMSWKQIELHFKKKPYKRNCERFYNRYKNKYS